MKLEFLEISKLVYHIINFGIFALLLGLSHSVDLGCYFYPWLGLKNKRRAIKASTGSHFK
jgi:hypothetical protein